MSLLRRLGRATAILVAIPIVLGLAVWEIFLTLTDSPEDRERNWRDR